jgi:hypothetical protein
MLVILKRPLLEIADKDVINSKLDVAIIASLPQSYEKANIRKSQDQGDCSSDNKQNDW